MCYRYLALGIILASYPMHGMQRYLSRVIETQEEETTIPSLYSLALTAFSRFLISEKQLTLHTQNFFGQLVGDRDSLSVALDLANMIDRGKFSHLRDKDEVLELLKRDMLLPLLSKYKVPPVESLTHEPTGWGNKFVQAMAMSPDGTKLAVATSQLTIWDISDCTAIKKLRVLEILDHRSKPYGSMQWTRCGHKLLLHCAVSICCWNTTSWELTFRYRFLLQQATCPIKQGCNSAFSEDGHYFLCIQDGPILQERPQYYMRVSPPNEYLQGLLIDLEELEQFAQEDPEDPVFPHMIISRHTCNWHEGTSRFYRVLSIAISPDCTYAVTAGADNTIKMCDLSALPELVSKTINIEGIVCAMAFSPDSKHLAYIAKKVELIGNPLDHVRHRFILCLVHIAQDSSYEQLEEFNITGPVDDAGSLYQDIGFPVDLSFDGRFIVVQIIKNSSHERQRILYDVFTKKWLSLPDEEHAKADIPDRCTILSSDLRYLFIANGRTGNNVKVMPLLARADNLNLRDLVRMFHPQGNLLENDSAMQ